MNHYDALIHMDDAEKLNYIQFNNLDVKIHINSDEMYISFDNNTNDNMVYFDKRLPNNQISVDYFNNLGFNCSFS